MSSDFTGPSIWSEARFPRIDHATSSSDKELQGQPSDYHHRSVFQHDYDRLLFSTPVRRLSDKTQVWPMDENDGVRTRLTHSHEVANLARSIGTRVFNGAKQHFLDKSNQHVSLHDTIQPLLLAIGLGHDLGNPPFGHQGEAAIGQWFKSRATWIYTHIREDKKYELEKPVKEDFRPEFEKFDGNPQTLRLLTKLQSHIDNLGLDLSAATLAASLKYPVNFKNREGDGALKKGGYFYSEKDVVDWVRSKTGLEEKQRHPLTWIMEACDDIAYSVLDVDDVLKKGMISPDDVFVSLRAHESNSSVLRKLESRFLSVENRIGILDMKRDIKIQYLRAFLIEELINHASNEFIVNAKKIFNFEQVDALMDSSVLCKNLKDIAKQTAFNHQSVLRAEAMGAVAIDGLMTCLWSAISNRKDIDDLRSKRLSARDKYIFSLISPNYIEQAILAESDDDNLCLRYRELRLLTDMMSGMTDTFAIRLWENLRSIPHVNCA